MQKWFWGIYSVLLVGFFLALFGVATTRKEVVRVVDKNDCVRVVGTREYNTKFLGLFPSGKESYKVLSDGREMADSYFYLHYSFDHFEGSAWVSCKKSFQEKNN